MYLYRYHEIQVSASAVWRILKRLDLSRLPASQRYKRHQDRWKRYEKPQPGHRVQVDVKFVAPIGGLRKKHYQFTAIDDCTRLRVLRVFDHLNQKTAIQFVDYVLEKLPFRVEVIQTDNGAEFQSAFHWHVLDRGIQHVYIKPATPRLNGKVERSHRIDAEEFYRLLDGVVYDDAQLLTAKPGMEDSTISARMEPWAATFKRLWPTSPSPKHRHVVGILHGPEATRRAVGDGVRSVVVACVLVILARLKDFCTSTGKVPTGCCQKCL